MPMSHWNTFLFPMILVMRKSWRCWVSHCLKSIEKKHHRQVHRLENLGHQLRHHFHLLSWRHRQRELFVCWCTSFEQMFWSQLRLCLTQAWKTFYRTVPLINGWSRLHKFQYTFFDTNHILPSSVPSLPFLHEQWDLWRARWNVYL